MSQGTQRGSTRVGDIGRSSARQLRDIGLSAFPKDTFSGKTFLRPKTKASCFLEDDALLAHKGFARKVRTLFAPVLGLNKQGVFALFPRKALSLAPNSHSFPNIVNRQPLPSIANACFEPNPFHERQRENTFRAASMYRGRASALASFARNSRGTGRMPQALGGWFV